MRSKWLNKIFEGVVALVFLFGLTTIAAYSQIVVPVGKTEEQTSQLIFWYDQTEDAFGRFSFIQVTNASLDFGVNIHVQIFASDNPTPGNPVTARRCVEHDFNDFLTAGDEKTYDLSSLSGINIDNTKGFVVVTAVDEPSGEAISFWHLFGNSIIFDFNAQSEYRLNAMGRQAKDFLTDDPAPEGETLDGIDLGLVLIQPDVLKFNFVTDNDEFTFADVVSIAFKDNYNSGPFGGYAAERADATWTPLLFDLFEDGVSCNPIPQDCFFDIGINDVLIPANPLLDDGLVLCPGNDVFAGWARISVSGLDEDELENELGVIGIIGWNKEFSGGASWMFAE
ncbi:MAG: hypothetical protein ACREOW_07145 [Thermodesulfobacteriota bacterium]